MKQRKKGVQKNSTESAHIPAPVGGLNTIDPGYQMPDLDCPLLYNMIGAENGLRSRLGYKEWCTGLTGDSDNTVRSMLPFSGSGANGAKDRLFANTSHGIYDVSASSAAPTQVLTFASSAADAGWGAAHGMVSASNQHFLLYCDEQNGYHVYSETNDSWVVPVAQAVIPWTKNTPVTINVTYMSNRGVTYKCSQTGTTENTDNAGPTGVGTGIVDGTATWDYAPSIGGVDPANIVFATVWKNFVLFVEKDTTKMWFGSAVRSLYGTVTSFDFGTQFLHGGNLVGLWSWTGDGGIGIDDHLIAISSSGDLVIYKGSDPNDASKFAVVGVWFVGGVPKGRRIATDFGGDLLILSSVGIVPISKLVSGTNATTEEAPQYDTHKIGNLFSRSVSTYGSIKGWSLHLHPEDNVLLVTLPVADGQATTQLAMSLFTHGWSQYRSLPILSCGVWGRKLYFGTADGRVCIHTDYLDNVNLAASSFTAVQCSGITAFRNLGNARQKHIELIRPTIISEGGAIGSSFEARYRYDLTEATTPSTPAGNADSWDVGLWDSARWGGAYTPQQAVGGAAGMGPDVAIAFALAATSRTVLTGIDVVFRQGGVL